MSALGTKSQPAVVRVASFDRAEQIMIACKQTGIDVLVGVEPHEPEDLSDLTKILQERLSASAPPPSSRRKAS
jgi:hypothetical protein